MYKLIRRCHTWRRTSADDNRSAAAVYGVDDGLAARSLTVSVAHVVHGGSVQMAQEHEQVRMHYLKTYIKNPVKCRSLFNEVTYFIFNVKFH